MKNTFKLALCGVVAALSVVLMLFEGLFSLASVAIPAVAGCLLIPLVAEAGAGYALGAYGATSLLCLLLAPDREAALIYLLFFGYYPVLFAVLSKIRPKALRWAAKLAVFNAAAIADALLAVFILGVPVEEFTGLPLVGRWGPVVLLALANVVFVLYDYTLAGLITQYFRRLHGRLARYFRH
ncbi:hypothetical protein [Acutalibacter caecimuris]|uniref:hypothetical protein n=1 Tax=Acutalibacter caecimuris TaxID=3093657 RepID=UPI002AC95349|nr:hypothetical protein [Acutalibacter sp. M00118]